MKNLILIFLLAISGSMFAQTIRRCNNSLGLTGVNMYATAQAAHDAAVAGDIIYLEPSSVANNDYGDLVITKQLTVVGPGYLLDKNPNTSFDTRVPRLAIVRFQKGSANSSITGVYVTSATYINCNNITITRCRLQGGISLGTNGSPATYGSYAFINKCMIENGISGSASDASGDNCTFSNNLIVNGSSQVIMSSLDNCTINNNTFASLNYGQYGGQLAGLLGCVVSNNIFDFSNYTYTFAAISSTGTTFSNNVCIGISALPTGNGNINGASNTNLYTNANPLATYTNIGDSVFQLGVGSAAIGVGTGGTNAGALGGSNPYLLSGLPSYPIISSFITSGVGNTSTPLSVSVTVRGNN